MANKFKKGDVVVMKSGGPPMTIDKLPGENMDYAGRPLAEYRCEWFKGATSQHGNFGEHLPEKYAPPQK